jgi:Zn-dependent metalloprotease
LLSATLVLDNLLNSDNPEIRNLAVSAIAAGAAARATRVTLASMPRMSAITSPTSRKYRLIYDIERRDFPLPGKLICSEGDSAVADESANEAYDYSGYTYNFYMDIFNRNSLDDNGMSLISSVHVTERGVNMSNAFWNGEQMAYGDGDGSFFLSFTKALVPCDCLCNRMALKLYPIATATRSHTPALPQIEKGEAGYWLKIIYRGASLQRQGRIKWLS